jgi:hypothetical protein
VVRAVANAVFPAALSGFLSGAIDVDTAVIKVALVRGYTYDSNDVFMSDVTGGGGTVHATSAALSSITTTGGAFDAGDVVMTGVSANASDHVLIVFQSSAVTGGADVAASAQRLIAYIDTGTGFPIVPNGGNVSIVWDSSILTI